MKRGDAQIIDAVCTRICRTVLVAQQHCVQGQVRATRMLPHVHGQAFDAATQRVEGCVALVALNFSATTLAADAALKVPAVSRDFVHALYRLHQVGVLHPELRDPLQSTLGL